VLKQINGTGKDGRVTKNDILEYVKNKGSQQLLPGKNQVQLCKQHQ
jgi:2-oxoglutarate dehydrogenase E2 component (dihydrolipoamide succinyltransferase)